MAESKGEQKRFCVYGPDGRGQMAAFVVTAENGRAAVEWAMKHHGMEYPIGVCPLTPADELPDAEANDERQGG